MIIPIGKGKDRVKGVWGSAVKMSFVIIPVGDWMDRVGGVWGSIIKTFFVIIPIGNGMNRIGGVWGSTAKMSFVCRGCENPGKSNQGAEQVHDFECDRSHLVGLERASLRRWGKGR